MKVGIKWKKDLLDKLSTELKDKLKYLCNDEHSILITGNEAKLVIELMEEYEELIKQN